MLYVVQAVVLILKIVIVATCIVQVVKEVSK